MLFWRSCFTATSRTDDEIENVLTRANKVSFTGNHWRTRQPRNVILQLAPKLQITIFHLAHKKRGCQIKDNPQGKERFLNNVLLIGYHANAVLGEDKLYHLVISLRTESTVRLGRWCRERLLGVRLLIVVGASLCKHVQLCG